MRKQIKNAEKPQKKRGIFTASGKRINQMRTMRFRFILTIFILFAITGITTALLFYLLQMITLFEGLYINGTLLIAAMALSCIIIGTILSTSTIKLWLGRITKISNGMREIAKGNFKTRVKERDREETISELGDLERSFNQMAADLDGIEMFRNDFINNFSHEFKTPIVSIRGFARQLQGGRLTEEQRKEYIDIIVEESERLTTMSQNVLLLTKLENQSIVSEKTKFLLDEQIRRSILLLEKSWCEKNIEFDIDMDEIEYIFNEEMLSHVWINLISNAIKFTDPDGKIKCTLKKIDGNVVATVEDDGIGMDEETQARIFEKFYQADSSHTTLGNGIGLNIVKCIVELAGGRIDVESSLGNGTKFVVTLP